MNYWFSNVKADPTWTGRRRVIRLTLLSCLVLSEQAVLGGPGLAQAVLPWTGGLAGAVIGSYVFGAAWERTSGIQSQNKVEDNVEHS